MNFKEKFSHPNWKKAIKAIRNKYLLTSLFFITWLLFFDRYDFFTQYKAACQLNDLNKEKLYYESEIKKNQHTLDLIQHDPVFIEKYARENYQMKKDDEDIFLVADKRKTSN